MPSSQSYEVDGADCTFGEEDDPSVEKVDACIEQMITQQAPGGPPQV